MNGKGSKPRPTDLKAYRANYDVIDWREKRPKQANPAFNFPRGEFPKYLR